MGSEYDDKCHETFAGSGPFSELESSAIKDYLEDLPEVPVLTLDIHAFANYILYPFGHGEFDLPDNVEEIKAAASEAAGKIPGMKIINAADFCKHNTLVLYSLELTTLSNKRPQ